MRSGSTRPHLTSLALLALVSCAGRELPAPPAPDAPLAPAVSVTPVGRGVSVMPVAAPPSVPALSTWGESAESSLTKPGPVPTQVAPPGAAAPSEHCAGIPPLGPDGAVPPAPPHTPLGQDVAVPGDRPVYVLPGESGDPRVIVYLHGMCGDVAAADYFRSAARAHGTLIALRGDTPCAGDRFKWRDDPTRIQERLLAAVASVGQLEQTRLSLNGALLFGYSQGADRAEKLAGRYPKQYRRIVLGGPPMKASPLRLFGAGRVAILGGELETTDNMRAGAEALQAAGIACRFFTLDCAYHGYYGTRAEAQLAEVLDWVSEP